MTDNTVNKIVLVPNRGELMMERILSQFSNSENIQKLMTLAEDEIQLLENTIIDMMFALRLTNATGVTLDNIGAKLNIYRNNATDNEFRNAIRIRAFRRTTQGTEEDLLKMIKFYTGDVEILIQRTKPYGLTITYNADCVSNGNGAEEMSKFFPLVTALYLQQRGKGLPLGFANVDDPNPTGVPFGNIGTTQPYNDENVQGSFVSLLTTPDDTSI